MEGHLKDLYSAYTTVEPAVTVRRDRMSCLYAYVELNVCPVTFLILQMLNTHTATKTRLSKKPRRPLSSWQMRR